MTEVSERYKVFAAVYLLLIKDGKVLLIRRANTGWSDGMYTVPSGHVEPHEPLTVATCREAKEEAGADVRPEDVTFVHAMHRRDAYGDQREYLDYFFMATKWQGEPYLAEPERSDDIQWFPLNAVPDNTLSYLKDIIADFNKGIPFSEIGWD
jgi:8-oxo-dGTP diphosphatase